MDLHTHACVHAQGHNMRGCLTKMYWGKYLDQREIRDGKEYYITSHFTNLLITKYY